MINDSPTHREPLLTSATATEKERGVEGQARSPVVKGIIGLAVLGAVGLFFYFLIYALTTTLHDPPAPSVTLQCGTVQGYWDEDMDGLAVFKGIPYAAPPVGALRWDKAQQYSCSSWNGTMDATKDSNICYQTYAPYEITDNQSEDCLYLNVWSLNVGGDPVDRGLPVMVWIHGGSNVFGSSTSYSSVDQLVRLGDVCLVAPNFRLGAFGFLSLPQLNGTIKGNYGISDLQLALQWIQDNIAAFGCDPTRVTLIGQSSGGTNILALLTNPANQGLFHAAISLSGSLNISQSLSATQTQHNEYLSQTNCVGTTQAIRDCLYQLTPEQLVAATPQSWINLNAMPVSAEVGLDNVALVFVDGQVIPYDLVTAFTFAVVDVPVILQSNRDELEFYSYVDPTQLPLNLTPAEYNQYLGDYFSGWPDVTTGNQLAAQYNDTTYRSVRDSYYQFLGDLNNFCGHLQLGALASQKWNSSVYVSLVTQGPAKPFPVPNTTLTDAFHFWDYIAATYAWDFVATDFSVEEYSSQGADASLGDLMRNQWYDLAWSLNITQSNSLLPANASYIANLQGTSDFKSTLQYDYSRSTYCKLIWDAVEVNQKDARFWWVN